ncbi:heme-binding protein [Henriciella sp. AS95]|uniref:GlcG/HbpS family heme-binding protein n=1 Tax=Henriciella sp. AS95 TaxID=3135782 RepID=UPI00317C44FD
MRMFFSASICAAINAVTNRAAEMDLAITVSFMDAAGNEAAFYRMPGAFLASTDYARWKAWTAASFQTPTEPFADMLAGLPQNIREGLLAHPKVTDLPGGALIKDENDVLGSVGISGGSGEQDTELALLAARTLLQHPDQNAPG